MRGDKGIITGRRGGGLRHVERASEQICIRKKKACDTFGTQCEQSALRQT